MRPLGILSVIVVLPLIVLAINLMGPSQPKMVTITATQTIAIQPPGGSPAIEEVIIQPEIINEVCILQRTNATSTAYLPSARNASVAGTTTTETLLALSTATVYLNATVISGPSTTCTVINPYYHVTQSSSCTCT